MSDIPAFELLYVTPNRGTEFASINELEHKLNDTYEHSPWTTWNKQINIRVSANKFSVMHIIDVNIQYIINKVNTKSFKLFDWSSSNE